MNRKAIIMAALCLVGAFSSISQATILKYVHCQYGTGKANLNTLSMDLHGQKLSNLELDANGWMSPTAKVGAAFLGDVPGAASKTALSVTYSDATNNTVKIEARGDDFKWRGTIEVHMPSPRAETYKPGTQLDRLLEGRFNVQCNRELDNEG